jgi:hypothetical protein
MQQRYFQYKAEFIVAHNVVSLYKIDTFIYLSNCYKKPAFFCLAWHIYIYIYIYIYIVSVLQEIKFLQIFIKYFTKMILQLPTSWQ